MIETNKSSLVLPSGGTQAPPVSKAGAQLEHWAQVQLKELKSLSRGLSEQSVPPSQQSGASTRSSGAAGGGFKMTQEPTIQDTLEQLSALAGGKAKKGASKSSFFMMDQNKPITPNDGENTTFKIKKEVE